MSKRSRKVYGMKIQRCNLLRVRFHSRSVILSKCVPKIIKMLLMCHQRHVRLSMVKSFLGNARSLQCECRGLSKIYFGRISKIVWIKVERTAFSPRGYVNELWILKTIFHILYSIFIRKSHTKQCFKQEILNCKYIYV